MIPNSAGAAKRGGLTDQEFDELTELQPWKQQRYESGQRYAAFMSWLRTPARERVPYRVAREISVPVEVLEAWRFADHWDLRTEAYDRYHAELYFRERDAALRTQVGNEVELIVRARGRAALLGYRIFDRAVRKEENTPEQADMPFSVHEAIKSLEYVQSVRDLGVSVSDDLKFDQFTDEELAEWKRLRAKAAGGS